MSADTPLYMKDLRDTAGNVILRTNLSKCTSTCTVCGWVLELLPMMEAAMFAEHFEGKQIEHFEEEFKQQVYRHYQTDCTKPRRWVP